MKFSIYWGIVPGLLLTTVSMTILIWSFDTPEMMKEELPVTIEGQWLETCSIKLEWNPLVRSGDNINITFLFGGSGKDLIPCYTLLADLYPDENLLIEASLEFPDMEILPHNTYIIPITSKKDVQLIWKASIRKAGKKQGRLWVYLNTIPLSEGNQGHYPILAREFEIEVKSILGLNVSGLRIFSLLGIAAGIYLNLHNIRVVKS